MYIFKIDIDTYPFKLFLSILPSLFSFIPHFALGLAVNKALHFIIHKCMIHLDFKNPSHLF